MPAGEDPEALAAALARRLEAAARAGETPTYGALSAELALPAPRIRRLAMLLEALVAEDAAAGRPLRAVQAAARLRGGLPAPGLLDAARAVGRYHGPDSGPAAEAWTAAERARLLAALGA